MTWVTRNSRPLSYSARPMSRAMLTIALLLAAFPLMGERVRAIVAVRPPAPERARSIEAQRAGVIDSLSTATTIERWGRGGTFVAELDEWELELVRRDPRVLAVSLDSGGRGSLLESIPLIGGDVVAAQGLDGQYVTVAVLDSGIDLSNPDFAGRVVAQQCFCDNLDGTGCCPNGATSQSGPGSAQDDHGHGTHVTGIIASAGRSGPRGLAPAARIVAVKVLDEANVFSSLTQIYRALEWIAENRAEVRVINMSLGTSAHFTSIQCASSAAAFGFEDVLQKLRARGVVITVSTGNDRSATTMEFPACDAGVIAVGATYDAPSPQARPYQFFGCDDAHAARDQVACFSNSSDAIDILAPGAPILSSNLGRGSITMVGTSMAAPHVAGTLALMMQASRGTITAAQAEQILRNTGIPVTDSRNGITTPRIDAAAAIAATPRPPAKSMRRAVRP
jgi:subtilisin family serine protease